MVAARTIRKTYGVTTMTRVRTGSTSLSGYSQMWLPGGRTEIAGYQWKTLTEKIRMTKTPITNSGSELATSAATDMMWSPDLSRRAAAYAPSPIPSTVDSTAAMLISTAELAI